MKNSFFLTAILLLPILAVGQNFQLVWEDNFNGTTLDSSKWNIEQKIGVWNTGSNREFQHYKKENVTVGNDGAGNNCLIITAKKEEYNGYHFTSGRVNTKGKFAFKRGKIEASIKIPNLANGLWPAFWTLGYTPTGWPDCGEIDILEMGHSTGIQNGYPNRFIGSHLFWGPYPRDYGKEFTTSEDLSDGFFTHTMIWDENKISIYFNNSATPYFSMGITGNDTEEFRDFQQYLIFNLAVGGSVPGIYDIGEITADFPASLYVDWVKVYQESDDFSTDNLPLYGIFGIFEENQPADMRMDLNYDIFAQETEIETNPNETPYAGNEVLSYKVNQQRNYQLALISGIPRNMTNYRNGSIQFYLKTNLSGTFQLGVADTRGNEAFIPMGEGTSHPIVNDGTWNLVYLPISEIAETVDIQSLKSMLIFKGNHPGDGYFSIDEIVYSETTPVSGVYGIYTNNPTITEKFEVNNVTGFLYNWDNTVSFSNNLPAYEGTDVLSLRSQGGAGWWGFGFFSSTPLNFENFANGYLHFSLRTTSSELFRATVNGANSTKGEITFDGKNDPYGFIRDGKWHHIAVPVAALVAQGLNLSACDNIFTMSGGIITTLGIDNVYLSTSEIPLENPAICKTVSISVSPKSATGKTGVRKKFSATGKNQFDQLADVEPTWECSGGTIDQDGYFTASDAGEYTITARMDTLSDSATIIILSPVSAQVFENEITVKHLPLTNKFELNGLEPNCRISVFNLLGEELYNSLAGPGFHEIDLEKVAVNSVCIINIRKGEKSKTVKISAH
jgi:beta-glucanase (GH16 family)